MTTTRRGVLLLAAALGTATAAARAQVAGEVPWPSRPVRIIVPAPCGGGTADTVARIFAQELEIELDLV